MMAMVVMVVTVSRWLGLSDPRSILAPSDSEVSKVNFSRHTKRERERSGETSNESERARHRKCERSTQTSVQSKYVVGRYRNMFCRRGSTKTEREESAVSGQCGALLRQQGASERAASLHMRVP